MFQAGGNEIVGNNLQEMILEAAENSLKRLYPYFSTADHSGWDKVYLKAKQGTPDALKAVGDDGEPSKNGVCKAILGMIAAGKKGSDIRSCFEDSPFGWPRDSVDGGMQVLLITGLIRAQDDRGRAIDPKSLERKYINKTFFKIESTTISTAQRIQIRKLLQKMKINVKQGEELASVSVFLEKMIELKAKAGGESPKPEILDIPLLEELRLTAGNEQLLAMYNAREDLTGFINEWNDLANQIDKRFPSWVKLKKLSGHAKELPEAEMIVSQVKHIEKERQLLEKTDLIEPLNKNFTQLLRKELNIVNESFGACWKKGEERLKDDESWTQLEPDQKYQLRAKQQLIEGSKPKINLESTDSILTTLDSLSLTGFKDRVAAMPARFDRLILEATRMMEPEIQEVTLPSRTIKTEDDLEAWLSKAKEIVQEKLKKGPVIL